MMLYIYFHYVNITMRKQNSWQKELGARNAKCSHYCSLSCDVRMSLLTMTNPNQLCDVLLFVCSKMADETNLSSKLPDADRTREV